MTSPNDSVIICDSPSPTKSNEWISTLTNYRKRLRSCRDFKALLDTVYESPLVHLKRNIGPRRESNNDVTVVSTPLAKKRKINEKSSKSKKNLDRSVVIINDATPGPVVDIGLSDAETSDVVDITKSESLVLTPKRREAKKKLQISMGACFTKLRTKRLVGNALRPKRVKKTAKTAKRKSIECIGVNDENRNGQIMEKSVVSTSETEEVEIVWISDANEELTSQQTFANDAEPVANVAKTIANEAEPIVIDTTPTPENLTTSVPYRSKRKKNFEGKRRMKKLHNDQGSSAPETQSAAIPIRNEKARVPCHNKGKLREIIIDGCNVAMGHKHGAGFSEKGLQIVIDYFKERGHIVTAFLPQTSRTRDRELLEKLHRKGYVVFTPGRRIGGKLITPYDDRFILEYATKCDGIVVSSDQYRDLWREKPQWRDTIENRLLMPTFVGDYLMFPEDPMGRTGPRLEEFLRY